MSKLIKFTYPCQRDDCEGTAGATMLDLTIADDAKVIEVDIEMAISHIEVLDGADL